MGNFFAGAAVTDITPSVRELEELKPMLGYNKNLFPGGSIRPLLAKVLATKTEEKAAVIITADLHNTPKWLSDKIRKSIASEFNVNRENIAVCTSQTHSSPEVLPPEWSYTYRIIDTIKTAAGEAYNSLRPAAIGAIKGYCHDISYNHNLPITEETPKSYYPDTKHIGGLMFARDHITGRTGGRPFDPETGVIRIDGEDGKPIAVIYNFSAHPATCIEGEYMHGDYVTFASEKIESELPGTTALFLQGSLGNAQIIPLFGTWEDAKRSGEKLASEVLRVLPDVVTVSEVTASVVNEPFPVTFISYPTERLKKFVGYINDFFEELKRNPDTCWFGEGHDTINLAPKFPSERRRVAVLPLLKYCENKLKARENYEAEKSEPIDTEIQLFRWNDIALCMNAFEMYYQTGFEIKRLSPFRYTFPVGNTNSLVGYVVPQEEFEYGGYNAFTSPMYCNYPGMIDPENCDRIIKRFAGLLKEI